MVSKVLQSKMPINCFSLYLTYICTCLLLWYLRVLLILLVILWPNCLWHLLSVNLSDPDAPKPEGNTMKPTDGGAAVVNGYSLHNTGNKLGQNRGVRWDLVTKCQCQNVNTQSPQHKKCSQATPTSKSQIPKSIAFQPLTFGLWHSDRIPFNESPSLIKLDRYMGSYQNGVEIAWDESLWWDNCSI